MLDRCSPAEVSRYRLHTHVDGSAIRGTLTWQGNPSPSVAEAVAVEHVEGTWSPGLGVMRLHSLVGVAGHADVEGRETYEISVNERDMSISGVALTTGRLFKGRLAER